MALVLGEPPVPSNVYLPAGQTPSSVYGVPTGGSGGSIPSSSYGTPIFGGAKPGIQYGPPSTQYGAPVAGGYAGRGGLGGTGGYDYQSVSDRY